MSRRLSDTRLSMLHHGLAAERTRVAKNYPGKPVVMEVDIREICCALDELVQRRGLRASAFGPSPITEWMVASQVGNVMFADPPTGVRDIAGYRTTARKRMENPDAKWSAIRLADGRIRIERIADDARYTHGKGAHPIVGILAAMNINGREIVDYNGKRLPYCFKQVARKRMGKPLADWRYRMLSTGRVKVERTR